MTDSDRFRLDKDRRAEYDSAKADLSRLRQSAAECGRMLEGLGKTLQELPQNVHLWKKENGTTEWRWAFSPHGQGLAEVPLPEWEEVARIASTIKALTSKVPMLEKDLRERRLID